MNLEQLNKKFDIEKRNTSSSLEDLVFDISLMITEARIKHGVTQTQLAKKMGTKQPSIARVENGGVLPSLEFLQKMAKALGTNLMPPSFEFLDDKKIFLKNTDNKTSTETDKYIFYTLEKHEMHLSPAGIKSEAIKI
jgi:ribosome-binding protein aMBF1 (putative translation factor)